MALWKAKSLTPEQKVQVVEEESEQKLQSEESGLFLGVDDVRFAEVYSLTLPVPVSKCAAIKVLARRVFLIFQSCLTHDSGKFLYGVVWWG